jgi:hypothetical protein
MHLGENPRLSRSCKSSLIWVQTSRVTDILGKTLVPDDEVRIPAAMESFLRISGVRTQGKE